MNNLTTTDLSRIFGERIGQDYLVCYNIEGNPVIEPITPKVIEDIEPDSHNKRDLLLLTPLENISDEDAMQLIQISSFYSGDIKLININVSGGIIHIDFEWADEERAFTRNIQWTLTWKEAEFLRNKGYDYQGLIEKGVAINKETLK